MPFDIFASQTSADILKFELDIAWAIKAGVDPVALFAKHKGRFPLWHVKDLNPANKQPARVGTGKVEFKHIFTNSQLSGVEHTFIEQDNAKSIDDPAASVKWLKENIYV